MQPKIRIATRASPLAIWQANYVKEIIQSQYPQINLQIIPITTTGDRIIDRALFKIGGKGMFIKELEQAILDNKADIAVHSLKDLPMILPKEFKISALLEREIPNDALVSNKFHKLEDIPSGEIVGTSSLRRQVILKSKYPNIKLKIIRGNLHTRLKKLDQGEYSGIILACAGLYRMGLKQRISQKLPLDLFIPAAGQGVIAIESLQANQNLNNLLEKFSSLDTICCCSAERAFVGFLQGGCEIPIGAYAKINYQESRLNLAGLVADPNGKKSIRGNKQIKIPKLKISSLAAFKECANKCGIELAKEFIDQGAKHLIEQALTKTNK